MVGYLDESGTVRLPVVVPDEQAIGEKGAERFLAHGYQRFRFRRPWKLEPRTRDRVCATPGASRVRLPDDSGRQAARTAANVGTTGQSTLFAPVDETSPAARGSDGR